MDNYSYNNNISQKSQIVPNTTKNRNYGNFSSYSKRNAPFSIKFKTNNNRANTQGQNEFDNENEMEYEKYNDEFDNESQNRGKKNGKVLNEIDDLKNDIMSALNKDDKNIKHKNKTNEKRE